MRCLIKIIDIVLTDCVWFLDAQINKTSIYELFIFIISVWINIFYNNTG